MRIKQMSDLHLEFDADFFPKNEEKADILMLNGDICMGALFNKGPDSPYYIKAQDFLKFFQFCSNEYENVLYIPGNHEYYRGYIDTTDDIIREALSVFPNIHFMNNQSWEKNGVTFIGATLWTDMNHNNPITEQYLMSGMNDFRIVKWKHDSYGGRFRPSDAAAFHRRTLKYFDEASAGLDNVVIMSHHAPSFMSVHPKYHNDTQMNYGYYSMLDGFIIDRPQIKLWTHGHMHDCFDYKINDTRVVCNPRGYRNENKFFKMNQILEV
jgi:Icc-related predicted phosphoesterase